MENIACLRKLGAGLFHHGLAHLRAPGKRRGKRADHEGSIYYWKARNRWVSCIRLGYNPQTGKEIRKKKYSRTQRSSGGTWAKNTAPPRWRGCS